jgi:hypothetical protein
MSKRIVLSLFCAALFPAALPAQDQAIPQLNGIYYQTASGWVPLRSTLFMPIASSSVAELLSLGHRRAVVEMPGPASAFRVPNGRPTFAVRGLSPSTGLYLVRSARKQTYREVRMPVAGAFSEWARFRSKDLSDIEMEPLSADVFRVRPRSDLAPGEYVLVSDMEPHFRAIRLGFDFGVTAPAGTR